MQGDVPSGYFKGYDAYGEHKTILPLQDPSLEGSTSDFLMRAEREVSACISADDLYDTMRLQGFSHQVARKAVGEKLGV